MSDFFSNSKYSLYLKLKEKLEKFDKKLKIRLIRSKHNLYFAAGNNKGIKMAKGEYICLLNSDTIVKSDFIEKMVEFLDKCRNAGMISPKIKVYKYSTIKHCTL